MKRKVIEAVKLEELARTCQIVEEEANAPDREDDDDGFRPIMFRMVGEFGPKVSAALLIRYKAAADLADNPRFRHLARKDDENVFISEILLRVCAEAPLGSRGIHDCKFDPDEIEGAVRALAI